MEEKQKMKNGSVIEWDLRYSLSIKPNIKQLIKEK